MSRRSSLQHKDKLDLVIDRAYSIFNSIDRVKLESNGIYRNIFDYELVYFYPPAKTLESIRPSDLFPGTIDLSPLKRSIGMYIHIPFCTGRCSYCHYIRFTNPQKELVEQYMKALKDELKILSETSSLANAEITSLHIGGGTPTFINNEQISDLMDFVRRKYNIIDTAEITWEASPETIIGNHSNKLQTLLDNGVNRLNIGIQSFEDHLLKICARRHTSEEAEEAILTARRIGFTNINIDVIYGLPEQTFEEWQHTLNKVEELRPESVTIYHLRIHPNNIFAKLSQERFLSEDTCLLMQIYGYEKLKDIGYKHLQPCQFVLSSENVHRYVIDKWEKSTEFIGIGMSSYGYFNDSIYFNHRTMNSYLNAIRSNELPIYLGKKLSLEQKMRKSIILGLKVLLAGVSQESFRRRFGISIREAFDNTLTKLENFDLIEISPVSVKLTQKGILFADEVCTEFYTEEEKTKLRKAMATKYGCYLPCS